jgi:two-component system nitrate/nitrite sensor histidine kinase NarX
MSTISPAPAIPFQYRLSTRIVALSSVALTLFLSMIVGTLWLSWQLEGAAAAINDAGSLRMRAGNVAIQASAHDAAGVDAESAALDQTLAMLEHGDPARPLFLPSRADIQRQFLAVKENWQHALKPVRFARSTLYLQRLPGFIREANALVGMIEHENANKTAWLRRSQIALAALACAGTAAIVTLLYAWFVVPVRRIEHGLLRLERRQFGARLYVDTRDEFGHLAHGFNRMADELQDLYRDLAQRVADKTALLAARNGELVALYEMTAFLHEAHDVDALCRGFLDRVMRLFNADGGSVRVLARDGDKLHIVVSEGLSDTLVDTERCLTARQCACGFAASSGTTVVRDLRWPIAVESPLSTLCRNDGFVSVAAFGIVSPATSLGSFALHFRSPRTLLPTETRLLETLGKHLGTALQNHRLALASRQLAVAQERHLVAQGLHDSIAQSLNFLKMQLYLLENATALGAIDEIREIVPLLRGGLEESYEDVRELLVNFRTKFGKGDLFDAIRETAARFERQSGTRVQLDIDESSGLQLPADQQLQVLFIVQEALSNVRKHALASFVKIAMTNAADFSLTVEDDGEGYDPADIAGSGDDHVGFHIMRERAARLGAQLDLTGAPGQGARVALVLHADSRCAA